MSNRIHRPILFGLPLVAAACGVGAATAVTPVQRFEDEVSYEADIEPIVRNFCTTCHAGSDPDGGFVLTSYEAVRKQAEHGDLLARINDADDPMPESGLMSPHLRHLFRSWADQGYRRKSSGARPAAKPVDKDFQMADVVPLEVGDRGVAFLKNMQGHWVGSMNLMGREFEWFAFDYRAIAPSHVHGIFEGGTVGNLFTSFFLAEYRGVRTLMARNGGVLNGIYRTSYFVLDRIQDGRYRFVDAIGGAGIMWMELAFDGDSLEFVSYTSRMGMSLPPSKHMKFVGKRRHPELAAAAARQVGFPSDEVHWKLPDGLPKPEWGEYGPVTSASYLWEGGEQGLVETAKLAGDPFRVDQMPHLASFTLHVQRPADRKRGKLLVYLSREALADANGKLRTEGGFLRLDLGDGILLFPEIAPKEDAFTFTYLHPGRYHLTVVDDRNGDGYPSPGDLVAPSRVLDVAPESHQEVTVAGGFVQN